MFFWMTAEWRQYRPLYWFGMVVVFAILRLAFEDGNAPGASVWNAFAPDASFAQRTEIARKIEGLKDADGEDAHVREPEVRLP